MAIYESDNPQYRGLWIGEGGGFIVTPKPEACLHTTIGDILLTVTAASNRLVSSTEYGGRFFFQCPNEFNLKRADAKAMQLLLRMKKDDYSTLVLQRRVGQKFTIHSTEKTLRDLQTLKYNPIVVELRPPNINETNHNRHWHKHLSFRIHADKRFKVSRPDCSQSPHAA